MIRILLLLVFPVSGVWADSNQVDPETKWTHSWAVGEDAASSSYYFMCHDQVRILWNGGFQNPPKVTEYFLPGGEIKVVHQTGLRKDLPDLILGRNAAFVVTSSYSLACAHSGKMLVPSLPDQKLTNSQRLDLHNLIMVLMEDRDPYKQGAGKAGAGVEANLLEGHWEGIEMWEGLKKEPVEAVEKISMTFEGGTLKVAKDGDVATGTFKIDRSQNPHRMDIQLQHDGEVVEIPVIFKIENDRLTICHAAGEGGELPGDFEVAEGLIVSTFQKVIANPRASE